MLGEEALDLIGIADELDRRALTHEKVIAHLDLPRARLLRDLASRIRSVVETSQGEGDGDGDRDAVHGEVVGLRLEAMCALLEEPISAPPVSPVVRARSNVAEAAIQPTPIQPSPIQIGRVRRRGS